ncbi:MAG: hypothetical protein J6S62_00605 [Bacteroidales bacterium]|nr:hypothetical protein [Bacteroidales bacterium]
MTEEELFPLDPEKVYYSMDPLTLETPEGPVTMKVGAWLNADPVRIHQMIVKEKVMQVDNYEVLTPLVSKLRRADPEYYRRFMGLNLMIDYPGYGTGVVARIPYENDPVGFYKWWRKGKHEDKVYLSLLYRIKLFEKVSMMDPRMILKKDLKTIQ